MKKLLFFCMLFLLSLAVMSGCSSDDNNNIPEEPVRNPPTFNVADTTLSADGGKVILRQTDGIKWFLYSVDSSPYDRMAEEYIKENPPIGLKGFFEVVGSWFLVERPDDRTIAVTLEKNETGEERELYIVPISSEDYESYTLLIVRQHK
ncbi:MAG: hypothetical protein IJ669_02940 [Prevotella sp.]|nr:hypothetical protein [Prevotella sp.]